MYSNKEELRSKESPAITAKSDFYPQRYEGKVPKRVKVLRTVSSELFFIKNDVKAIGGQEYFVWVNSHGAVAAIIGEKDLGLKPNEFEVVEYH